MISKEMAIEGLKGLKEVFVPKLLKANHEGMGEIDAKEFAETMDLAVEALEKQLNGGWIPFETEYDEDYSMNMLQGKIPDDEQEIFVTDGENVWSDTFMRDGIECYLDSGNSLVDKVIAWQPLPEPYKEVEH